MSWKIKEAIIASGRSNQKIPDHVWLYSLCSSNRTKDSKSGMILPIINPVDENIFRRLFNSGNTIAGCEKVKGIKMNYTIIFIYEFFACFIEFDLKIP